jgi:hypothetical protein
VLSDRYDPAEKQRDDVRAEALVEGNVVSRHARDLAVTAVAQSAATLAHDEAMVSIAEDNIVLARATLAADQEKLKLDQVTLSYTTLMPRSAARFQCGRRNSANRQDRGWRPSPSTISTTSRCAPMSTSPISARSASAN